MIINMKRIIVLTCMIAILFVGTALSEPIEFPNGIIVDVAPGWSYEGEGDSIILLSEDESCAIAIVITEAGELKTSEEAAKLLSKEHNGSEPEKIDDDAYEYSFKNETGVNTRVFVGIEDGRLKVLSITGNHKDVEGMIDSITEKK
jgi:hypothetical protein